MLTPITSLTSQSIINSNQNEFGRENSNQKPKEDQPTKLLAEKNGNDYSFHAMEIEPTVPEISTTPFLASFSSRTTFLPTSTTKHLHLESTDPDTEITTTHLIQPDNDVLIRPPDNSRRPYIGEIREIVDKPPSTLDTIVTNSNNENVGKKKRRGRKRKAKKGNDKCVWWVRVRWYYRGEDLVERPNWALGEDELFETAYFDWVEAETIVGRCEVVSYKEYREGMECVGEEGRSGFWGGMVKESEVDGGVRREESRLVFRKGVEDGYRSDGTDFGDNYSGAAKRYYVRYFYDVSRHRFVASGIDDPGADPYGELMSKVTSESDSEYEVGGGEDRDDDDDNKDFVGNDEDGRPRKKRRVGDKQRKKGRKIGAMHYFVLPGESREGMRPLPCRDCEKQEIRQFIEEAVHSTDSSAKSRCLYISGVPGTGKTATVREIVGVLEQEKKSGSLPPFCALEVNGLSLADPNAVYSLLHDAVTGQCPTSSRKSISPMHAASLLDRHFRSRSEPKTTNRPGQGVTRERRAQNVILILDEMDALLTRKQRVLYDLVEWTTCARGGLALVGIANTMDLPERSLLPRIGSRLGLRRVVFAPYTASQLKEILLLRLDERYPKATFQPISLQLVAAKVAAVSGDVRRALEICARAVELVTENEDENSGNQDKGVVITPEIVNKAVNDLSGAGKIVILQNLSLLEKVVVVCVLRIVRRVGLFDGSEGASMATLVREVVSVGVKAGVHMMKARDIRDAAWRLDARNILIVEFGSLPGDEDARVVLGVMADDVTYALEGSDLLALLNVASTNPIG